LIRLGLTEHITEYLPPQQFVPPPGQGVLAVEMRDGQEYISELLKTIEHSPTRQAITAERAFLETLGGGCQVPVGAYAYAEAETLILTVFIGSPDGERVFRDTLHGSIHNPVELATNAYEALVQQGAGELLETARTE
jgi:hydroxymethylbilane synthase